MVVITFLTFWSVLTLFWMSLVPVWILIISDFLQKVGLTFYNIICGGSQMASDFDWIFTFLIMESPTIIISFFDVDFITPWFSLLFEFFFSQFNPKIVIIYRLVFSVIGRSASIDRTTLATLNILNGSMMRLMVKWKSKTRVTSSNPRVTSSIPQVTSSNSRVRTLKARVTRSKARVEAMKPWLR